MKKAAHLHDKKQIRKLIAELDSDDAAVRFYAIKSLKELTGETFGYHYYQDDDERKPAIDKWKQWLKNGQTTTEPSTEPSTAPASEGKS